MVRNGEAVSGRLRNLDFGHFSSMRPGRKDGWCPRPFPELSSPLLFPCSPFPSLGFLPSWGVEKG